MDVGRLRRGHGGQGRDGGRRRHHACTTRSNARTRRHPHTRSRGLLPVFLFLARDEGQSRLSNNTCSNTRSVPGIIEEMDEAPSLPQYQPHRLLLAPHTPLRDTLPAAHRHARLPHVRFGGFSIESHMYNTGTVARHDLPPPPRVRGRAGPYTSLETCRRERLRLCVRASASLSHTGNYDLLCSTHETQLQYCRRGRGTRSRMQNSSSTGGLYIPFNTGHCATCTIDDTPKQIVHWPHGLCGYSGHMCLSEEQYIGGRGAACTHRGRVF